MPVCKPITSEDNRRMGTQCLAHTRQGFPLELRLGSPSLSYLRLEAPLITIRVLARGRVRVVVNGFGTVSSVWAHKNPASLVRRELKAQRRCGEEQKQEAKASGWRVVEGIEPWHRASNLNEAFPWSGCFLPPLSLLGTGYATAGASPSSPGWVRLPASKSSQSSAAGTDCRHRSTGACCLEFICIPPGRRPPGVCISSSSIKTREGYLFKWWLIWPNTCGLLYLDVE